MNIRGGLLAGIGSLLLLASVGCETVEQRQEREEKEKQRDATLEELKGQVASLHDQVSDLGTKVAAKPEPGVVPVEDGNTRALTPKDRFAELDEYGKRSAYDSPRGGSKRSASLAAKYIRVPVSVRNVQIALKNAGFNPGPIDGQMGDRTITAIKAFQKKEGLKVDGVVGRSTWARLSGK